MPHGEGTYGSQVGRPPKKDKKKKDDKDMSNDYSTLLTRK